MAQQMDEYKADDQAAEVWTPQKLTLLGVVTILIVLAILHTISP